MWNGERSNYFFHTRTSRVHERMCAREFIDQILYAVLLSSRAIMCIIRVIKIA